MAVPAHASRDIDGGWAWMIMIGATSWNIIVSGTLKTFSFVFMEYQDIFEATPSETAWMGCTFSLMMIFISPFVGYLSDRLPARWIAMVAALTGTLGIVFTGLAPSLTAAILCYGLVAGAGAAVMDTPVFGMLNQYFVKKRARANSVAFAGSGIGCVLLPLVLNFAIEHYGARGSMFILAGLWAHAFIIAAILKPLNHGFVLDEISVVNRESKVLFNGKTSNSKLPVSSTTIPMITIQSATDVDQSSDVSLDDNSPDDTGVGGGDSTELSKGASFSDRLLIEETIIRPDLGDPLPPSSSGSLSSGSSVQNVCLAGLSDYWTFLKNLNLILCFFGIALGCFAYFNQLFLFPLYAHELGYSKRYGAVLVSITGGSEVISRLLMSGVADGKKVDKTLLVVTCSLICGLLGLCVTFYAHLYVLMTYAAILGCIGGTLIPLAMPIVTGYIGADRISSATGLFLCAMGSAFASGPHVTNAIKDLFGLYVHSFRFCILLYIPCCLLFLVARHRKAKHARNKANRTRTNIQTNGTV